MTRDEAINKDKKTCLNPHATRAQNNRAIQRLVNNGVRWDRVRMWLLAGHPDERRRLLEVVANPKATDAQTRSAAQKLLSTGMSFTAVDLWYWMARASDEEFSRVFRRVAKRMPHILRTEEET